MPPKTNLGAGKKKGEKMPTKAPLMTMAVSEQSKEYLLMEIKDLERRLARYEKKYEELSTKNSTYQTELEQTLQDEKEAVTIHRKTLEQKTHELADIKDRLIGLQQAKDFEREWYEKQLQQLGTEYKETKDQLISENIMIGTQLAQLDDFKVTKSDLMAKLTSLEDQVNGQKDTHQEELNLLENKDVIARDRMKGHMLSRVNQVAAAFQKVSHQEMAETTKRTIQENVLISSQLGKMSECTDEIGQENTSLKDYVITGCQQIKAMEAREIELARNYISSRKIIGMLKHQVDLLKELLTVCEAADEDAKLLQVEADVLREKFKVTRDEVIQSSAAGDALKSELENIQKQLKEENKTVDSLTRVIVAVARKLKSTLLKPYSEEVKGKNFNMLEDLYNQLVNWKDKNSSADVRKQMESMKIIYPVGELRTNKICVLPPINPASSKLRSWNDGVDASAHGEWVETKDACTQTGSTKQLSASIRTQLLIRNLTLNECEQVLTNQYKAS